MINLSHIQAYQGPAFFRGDTFLYLPPHPALRPYISNYTLTFPFISLMQENYTILPSASATIVCTSSHSAIQCALRGVNTKASEVGAYAAGCEMLLLIEFQPAGLYPLIHSPQNEMVDTGYDFNAIDPRLDAEIKTALIAAPGVSTLMVQLDSLFLARLSEEAPNPYLSQAMAHILAGKGAHRTSAIAANVFYGEKQLNRIFKQQLGTTIKSFSRIVRVNHAIRLLADPSMSLTQVAVTTGYYDQAHFIRDIQNVCGITPMTYRQNMSQFYNETTKL